MASSQNSPVLVQHASPPHTLSPSMPVVSISAFEPSPLPESIFGPPRTMPPLEQNTTTISVEEADTEMANAPAPLPVPVQEPSPLVETLLLPQEELPAVSEQQDPAINPVVEDPITSPAELSVEGNDIPPPVAEEPSPEVPEWATWEDDLSTPDEEEMTQINARDFELSALDVPSVEKRIYNDVDDPDQRPVKKLRLSWVIKNLRGSRNKPNPSRVMISPPAEVDGNYWQIKFYPRGNKCSSLSAYIRCSPIPPKPEPDTADSTFSFYEGSPEADLGSGAVPTQTLTIEAKHVPDSKVTSTATLEDHETQKHENSQENSPESSQDRSQERSQATDDRDAEAVATDNIASADAVKQDKPIDLTWRVAAQLGVIMYNPAEPRTCTYMSSEHQFSRANDDWGWTNFHGPWREIHRRQHAQRTALLQHDTIAIDAYIRIYDDPSQALWWHASESEAQWDARALAGYFPMGTPGLYHSPAVAGLTAWLHLAPFRKALQAAEAGGWRTNSQIQPRPVLSHLQKILFLMQWLLKEKDAYVDVYPLIRYIRDQGETFTDVVTFWESFRRSIELELGDDSKFMQEMATVFDSPEGRVSLPPLPVEDVSDIQQGLDRVLQAENIKGRLPNFLSLPLAREKFDKRTREWKLLYDRVMMNDEIMALDQSVEGGRAGYTLYGFMVQVGERNSGKIYTVIRPKGPGSKWLAFEDGDGNKIFSYTRKRINEYEGLEGQALKDFTSTRQTAYLVMYIRTSCLSEYLPGTLERWQLPRWLLTHVGCDHTPEDGQIAEETVEESSDEVEVELYSDDGLYGREGLLDMFNIKKQSEHKGLYHCLTIPKCSTFQDLRTTLSRKLDIDDASKIRFFIMSYEYMCNYERTQLRPIKLSRNVGEAKPKGQPLCVWYSVLKTKEDVEHFRHRSVVTADVDLEPSGENSEAVDNVSAREDPSETQMAAADAEQASVQEAVIADLERAPVIQTPELLPLEEEGEVADTPMQLEDLVSIAEDSILDDVPHGHLVDAANHHTAIETLSPTSAEPTQNSGDPAALGSAEERIIAAVVSQEAEMMDFSMQNPAETQASESQSTESSEAAPSTSGHQYKHTYGFIQIFDLAKQNFMVFGTFFAKNDDKVKDFLRTRMGYIAADKDFNVWRRDSDVEGGKVGADETFQDHRIDHGVNLIIGEVVSDAEAKELEQQGKFSDPFALSKYLRMVDRKHPTKSLTTDTPVEIAVFGTDYYKGPLVNGRAHGPKCLCITGSGNIYEGPLVCDTKSGPGGKMTYQNGDTYEGEWEADERHGQGTFVENRTGNKYVGGFEFGKRWGMGTTYWQVADEQADLCQICYGEEIDALFFDCGHVCSCVECARQCEICPICRRSVKQVVKMFRA